jgi:NADPH-dependent glutamate synthase beta subunit-like oxidoreductase
LKHLYPVYINRKSPCYSHDHLGNTGCPAKNDIPRFLHLVTLKRFKEAFYILKETNPFSAGCGRFCDHPCELACNRAKYDDPVDIKSLERFVADWGYANDLKPIIKSKPRNKQIGIIGSGPSGLSCAYFLAVHGYKVVVFEKHDRAGGLLVEGIPAYRYPREVFERELSFIKAAGVEIVTSYSVDKNRFLNLAEEFDALIVATGASEPNLLNIEGEDLKGVLSGLEFLRNINFGENKKVDVKKGEKILVIGGGYTAFDVARVSVRLGAEPVIVYRRTQNEMTAHPGELNEAEREGVHFKFLLQPLKIKRVNNKLHVICQKMKLGPVDESGRSKPVPVKDVIEELICDKVILAIGDRPNLFFVGERFQLEFPRLLCPDLPQNLRDKIFLTGDASMGSVEGIGMVVRSIGLAQETSKAVRAFLGENVNNFVIKDIAYFNDLNTKYFEHLSRLVEKTLPFDKRNNFKEIVETVEEDLAVLMANRCFFCGICIQCDWCYYYSNGSIVKNDKTWSPEVDDFFYYFIKDKLETATFKSVEACPRAALSIVREESIYRKYLDCQYKDEGELTRGDKEK